MIPQKERRPKLGGAVYIFPNLVTTGNLFFGFFSIIKSLQGDFGWAAPAIVLAAVFDVLDGSVARLTGGTSEFGVQYDSLCDLVSFGLAPAVLMYTFGLNQYGRLGWVICFMFLACGALRLARFNVQSSIGKASGDFTGLPIPMSAAVIACFVAMITEVKSKTYSWEFMNQAREFVNIEEVRSWFLMIAGFGLAIAMVSNIKYRSHKGLKFKWIKPFQLLVGVVVLAAVVASQPEIFGFLFFCFYAMSGPLEWVLGWKKATDEDEIFSPADDDDERAGNLG